MRIVILGHSVAVKRAIEATKGSDHEICAVFTHPRKDHQRDLELYQRRIAHFGEYAYDVFDVDKDFGIPIHEYDDLSTVEGVAPIKNLNPDAVVTIGCRDILPASFIEQFPIVFNLHPYYLPYYRGAGLDSWMILHPQKNNTYQATAHFITPRIDAGKVIATAPYSFNDDARPIDIFKVRMDTLGTLFTKALEELGKDSPVFEDQDDTQSFYFPRLSTLRDGEIQFQSWTIEEIKLFIRAFSYPYEGAWTEVNGEKIHIHQVQSFSSDKLHSFTRGLVFRKSEKSVHVFVKDGFIELSNFEKNGAPVSGKSFRLGKKLS